MKYSAALATFTMAIAALAAPTELEARTGGGSGGGGSTNTCSSTGQKQVCCNGILACVVQVLGTQCSSDAYCCKTEAPVGTLISINALNCISL
ncbi:hypothetical protein NM208_g1633 [Fusarium decemcellulare]|uniref:Uncharacterized protein n=2 Tax=Fusarium decemcellulare TaxID=57161 RepID=A0ACC1SVP0_9HYPO|nr:hypothetical protein NM208_g2077 [Fusarium decemcellulare]KAJ3547190.1 hypothetical protein NM208_g1633 [Fusarium decemcellulare]